MNKCFFIILPLLLLSCFNKENTSQGDKEVNSKVSLSKAEVISKESIQDQVDAFSDDVLLLIERFVANYDLRHENDKLVPMLKLSDLIKRHANFQQNIKSLNKPLRVKVEKIIGRLDFVQLEAFTFQNALDLSELQKVTVSNPYSITPDLAVFNFALDTSVCDLDKMKALDKLNFLNKVLKFRYRLSVHLKEREQMYYYNYIEELKVLVKKNDMSDDKKKLLKGYYTTLQKVKFHEPPSNIKLDGYSKESASNMRKNFSQVELVKFYKIFNGCNTFDSHLLISKIKRVLALRRGKWMYSEALKMSVDHSLRDKMMSIRVDKDDPVKSKHLDPWGRLYIVEENKDSKYRIYSLGDDIERSFDNISIIKEY
ncbi:MAG: DNA-binding transcriptional ArsR family regulator [Thermoproteota archaeon]|jgi:DNA-binding transcriptional ArsR family regulator